jgi:hypothetical protein
MVSAGGGNTGADGDEVGYAPPAGAYGAGGGGQGGNNKTPTPSPAVTGAGGGFGADGYVAIFWIV